MYAGSTLFAIFARKTALHCRLAERCGSRVVLIHLRLRVWCVHDSSVWSVGRACTSIAETRVAERARAAFLFQAALPFARLQRRRRYVARPAREPSPRRGSPDADPALGRGIAAACAADAVSQGALYLVVCRGAYSCTGEASQPAPHRARFHHQFSKTFLIKRRHGSRTDIPRSRHIHT